MAIAKVAQDKFTQAMLNFCSKSKEPALHDFNVRIAKGGWPAVFATASEAKEVYESKRTGFKGFFRRADIAIAKTNPVVDPLLDLLPCGEYTSVVFGSIKLIFAAFKRKAETKDLITDTLGSAPIYLEQVEDFLRLYSQDQALQDLAVELFVALLEAIEACVVWLSQSSTRVREMLTKPDAIKSKRDAVDAAARRMNERATICDRQENIASRQMTEAVLSRIVSLCQRQDQNQDQLNTIVQGSDDLKMAFVSARKQLTRFNQNVEEFAKQQRSGSAETYAIAERMNISLQEVKQTLAEQLASAQQRADLELKHANEERKKNELLHAEKDWLRDRKAAADAEIHRLHIENSQLKREKSAQSIYVLMQVIASSQMSEWLGNLGGAGKFDASCYAGRGPILGLGQMLLAQVTTSTRFLNWIGTTQSQMILVDISGSTAKHPKISPGSYVSATLARAVDQQTYALVLQHFCAQHQSKSKDFDVVSNVLASLICQLLDAYPFDLASWTNDNVWGYNWISHCQLAPERHLQYLCRLFEHLTTSLRYNTAFVFVDDLYLLERSAESESLQMMYDCFRRIMASSSNLKVLFVTPDSNRAHPGYIYSKARDDEILRIDLEDEDQSGSPNARHHRRYHGGDVPLSTFV